MTTFIEDLWNSIFTPGPTSTLLIATNVTFGALQVVLLALLIATYSIHFLILSVLCGGLWGAINWFANELYTVQAEEEAKKRANKDAGAESTDEGLTADDRVMDTGDDTEIEVDDVRSATRTTLTPMKTAKLVETPPSPTQTPEQETPKPVWNTSLAAQLAPASAEPLEVRKRRTMADSNSSISTDSEWEKVEGES
jgi:hypothetical protein